MRISDSRIKLLGRILRHPSSSESLICFDQSYSLRTISSSFRRGRPRAHWPELVLAEAPHRAYILHQAPPHTWGFPAFFLSTFHYRWAKAFFPLPAWNSGTIPRDIFTSSCQLRKTNFDGSCFTPKWNGQPSLGTMLLRTCVPIWTTYCLWKKMHRYQVISSRDDWPSPVLLDFCMVSWSLESGEATRRPRIARGAARPGTTCAICACGGASGAFGEVVPLRLKDQTQCAILSPS